LISSCKEKDPLSDAYGNFEAVPTTISSEANGSLLYLNVEEGSFIPAGKLVAIVDTTTLHLQKEQIQATINSLPRKLRNSLAEIAVTKDQIANATRERDRIARLVEKKAATQKQLDDLNGEIEVLQARIKAIRDQTEMGNTSILSEKEPLLAQISIIENQLRKAYVHNPISGTVLTKLSEPHEVVGMGTPLYRIGNLDTITLRFYADAIALQDIALGHKIQVLTDDGKQGYHEQEGVIYWISDEAEFTPKSIQTKEDRVNLVYAVKASVPNSDGRLKMGMPAEVNFTKKSIAMEQK
jgi:HlyD family secretion protein